MRLLEAWLAHECGCPQGIPTGAGAPVPVACLRAQAGPGAQAGYQAAVPPAFNANGATLMKQLIGGPLLGSAPPPVHTSRHPTQHARQGPHSSSALAAAIPPSPASHMLQGTRQTAVGSALLAASISLRSDAHAALPLLQPASQRDPACRAEPAITRPLPWGTRRHQQAAAGHGGSRAALLGHSLAWPLSWHPQVRQLQTCLTLYAALHCAGCRAAPARRSSRSTASRPPCLLPPACLLPPPAPGTSAAPTHPC